MRTLPNYFRQQNRRKPSPWRPYMKQLKLIEIIDDQAIELSFARSQINNSSEQITQLRSENALFKSQLTSIQESLNVHIKNQSQPKSDTMPPPQQLPQVNLTEHQYPATPSDQPSFANVTAKNVTMRSSSKRNNQQTPNSNNLNRRQGPAQKEIRAFDSSQPLATSFPINPIDNNSDWQLAGVRNKKYRTNQILKSLGTGSKQQSNQPQENSAFILVISLTSVRTPPSSNS